MLDSGLIAEVKGLLNQGVPISNKALLSVGYFECLQFLKLVPQANDQLPIDSLQSLREGIIRSTMKLAKAQKTYLRGQFSQVEWLDTENQTAEHLFKQLRKRDII